MISFFSASLTSWKILQAFQIPYLCFSTSEKSSPLSEMKFNGLKCKSKQHFFLQSTVPLHNYHLKLPSDSHNSIWQIFCKTEVCRVLLLATGHINKMSLRSLSFFPSICALSSQTAYFSFCPFPLGSCLLRKRAKKQQSTNLCIPLMWKRILFERDGGEREREKTFKN